jgi:hypothetical protein
LPSADGAGSHSIECLNLTSNGSACDQAERAGKTSAAAGTDRDVGVPWRRALPDRAASLQTQSAKNAGAMYPAQNLGI